jgi:hypothetical protein
MTPHVHDLLLIKSGSLSSADGVRPVWVSSFLAPNLWVVVRRAIAPAGLVAVGLRGSNRQQRWGGFAESSAEIVLSHGGSHTHGGSCSRGTGLARAAAG